MDTYEGFFFTFPSDLFVLFSSNSDVAFWIFISGNIWNLFVLFFLKISKLYFFLNFSLNIFAKYIRKGWELYHEEFMWYFLHIFPTTALWMKTPRATSVGKNNNIDLGFKCSYLLLISLRWIWKWYIKIVRR